MPPWSGGKMFSFAKKSDELSRKGHSIRRAHSLKHAIHSSSRAQRSQRGFSRLALQTGIVAHTMVSLSLQTVA
jgi:hypothetical protein